jgi:hypothetical protein
LGERERDEDQERSGDLERSGDGRFDCPDESILRWVTLMTPVKQGGPISGSLVVISGESRQKSDWARTRFPAKSEEISDGFSRKSPRYINPVILWIDLLIVELRFNHFWGFSIDWLDDLVLIND